MSGELSCWGKLSYLVSQVKPGASCPTSSVQVQVPVQVGTSTGTGTGTMPNAIVYSRLPREIKRSLFFVAQLEEEPQSEYVGEKHTASLYDLPPRNLELHPSHLHLDAVALSPFVKPLFGCRVIEIGQI